MIMNKEFLMAKNMSIKDYNTMRIFSIADHVYFPLTTRGVVQLSTVIEIDKAIIIGQGSNTIFSKDYYHYPIINTSFLNRIESNDDMIVADAGVTLSKLSWYALENSCTGFEFLEDIPGSVAGALFMNAGTYNDTIGKLVKSVTVFEYDKRRLVELSVDQLSSSWGKRQSYFQKFPCFIIQCKFIANNKGRYEDILDKMLTAKKNRYLKQPREYPSAGSVFKRPYVNGEPRYVWKLFDEAGLRGYRIGDAQVSEKHPGFIVNVGNASGQDVINLMKHCKEVVFKQYGIQLEEEWKIV